MNDLMKDPFSLLAALLLMASVFGLWLRPQSQLWKVLSGVTVVTAWRAGHIDWSGVVVLAVLSFVWKSFYQAQERGFKRGQVGWGCVAFFLSLGLGFHKLPGFSNWLLFPQIQFSSDAMPVAWYVNFDKPWMGILIIGYGFSRIGLLSVWKRLFQDVIAIVLGSGLCLIGMCVLLHYVKWDPKLTEWTLPWLLMNVSLVCVSEEAFFRGFIQKSLSLFFGGSARAEKTAWVLASIGFGLAHLRGGYGYSFYATIAGLFYGYAFLKTKRIEASILVHFFVNALHFLMFTYPALK